MKLVVVERRQDGRSSAFQTRCRDDDAAPDSRRTQARAAHEQVRGDACVAATCFIYGGVPKSRQRP
jgi:hypothetical protein